MRYRKKPVVIEAVKWDPQAKPSDFPQWFWDYFSYTPDIDESTQQLMIKTLEGEMRANPGDWIIKGVQGELYPCKPDVFEETYILVD